MSERPELPERLRELGEAVRGCAWELPVTAREDCVGAAAEIERIKQLRSALTACASVAAGQFLACSTDRCEAIQEIVRKAFVREVEDE